MCCTNIIFQQKDSWSTSPKITCDGLVSKDHAYRKINKVFMEAVAHNLKRWIKIEELANELFISFSWVPSYGNGGLPPNYHFIKNVEQYLETMGIGA
jgi:hypothetical protein